jgi:glycosyltransferase involved in cell wall biosynthesis
MAPSQQRTIAIDATLVGAPKSGDATYWTSLVEALAGVADGFTFLLISNAPKPPDVPALPPNFRWVPLKPRPSRWFSLVTLPLAARRLGASALHTQYNLSPLADNGITTIHDVSFFIGPQWFRPRDRFLLRRFVPASARRAKKVITVSATSKGEISKHLRIDESKIAVTHLAAHPRFHPFSAEESRPILEKYGVARPYILSVSTQWPRKNFALAYDAVSLLPDSIPHKLVVTGSYDWGAKPLTDHIVATGFIPNSDLPALYSQADLYLCTSHHEGFGVPNLEAMACGAPVLTSAGGALPEIAGDAAAVMADMTSHSWAHRIEALLGDSSILSDLRRRGIERAKEFTWDETARRTLAVYREVAQ